MPTFSSRIRYSSDGGNMGQNPISIREDGVPAFIPVPTGFVSSAAPPLNRPHYDGYDLRDELESVATPKPTPLIWVIQELINFLDHITAFILGGVVTTLIAIAAAIFWGGLSAVKLAKQCNCSTFSTVFMGAFGAAFALVGTATLSPFIYLGGMAIGILTGWKGFKQLVTKAITSAKESLTFSQRIDQAMTEARQTAAILPSIPITNRAAMPNAEQRPRSTASILSVVTTSSTRAYFDELGRLGTPFVIGSGSVPSSPALLVTHPGTAKTVPTQQIKTTPSPPPTTGAHRRSGSSHPPTPSAPTRSIAFDFGAQGRTEGILEIADSVGINPPLSNTTTPIPRQNL